MRFALIAACMLAAPCAVAAQDAGIAGAVTDDTGGVLPGVTVEASGAALPAVRVAFTDGDGLYSLTGLPPGGYVVTFTLPGFERAERDVELTAGLTATVDVDLQLGGLFEEVTVSVTGTAIEAPAINMPHAVTVVSRETLEQQGATQLVDLFRNLNVSHGVVGERNSWYNSNQPSTLTENVANVNLRGLGASRTLVLINGRRHVSVPARLIGGRFVDVNTIPAIAVGRLEVLKEGASATYGSDAVGGVANFVTRSDFRGFEMNVSHDWFDSAGDTTVAGIWGGRIGTSSAVLSAERVGRAELRMEDRPWTLDRLGTHVGGNRAGWSSLGNPGTFAVGAPAPWTADVFDPRCTDFGGQDEGWTCRFRYAPYDNLIDEQQQTRVFAELNGPLNDRTNYHVEGLWSDAVIPNWYTTPSYPPFPLTSTTIMEVAADHPGRQAFCGAYAGDGKADPMGACMGDAPWYLNGRPFGNSGPGRRLRRESRTQRMAASVDGDFTLGGRAANWDLGVSYARARGNLNLPAVYTDRIFRAFRGYGGPDCGVGVTADLSSPAGMVLGPLGGAVAGQGPCMYYNPFSNAIQYSDQPGAPFRNTANPDYAAGLANPDLLRTWLNEEVDLVSTTDLFVADATVSGNLVENVADFAVGYQYRGVNAEGDPNDPGDVTLNPCPVAGDMGCSAGNRFGAVPLHQRPPALCRGPAGAAAVRRAGPGRRPPRRHAARGQLRVLQRGRPPREQLRPQGRLAHPGGGEPALLAVVPRLCTDHLPDAVARRPEHQPADDPGVDQRDRRLPGGRPLRPAGPGTGTGLHLQRGRRAVPGGGRRSDRRLLALRLRERDRVDALRRDHQPVRQRRRGHPRRRVAVHRLSRRTRLGPGPRRTGAAPRTCSESRSTW